MLISKTVAASDVGSGFSFREVGGAAVGCKDSVRDMEMQRGIGVCCGMVEELEKLLESVVSAFGLLESDGADVHKDCAVLGAGAVKEDTNDFLWVFEVGAIKGI